MSLCHSENEDWQDGQPGETETGLDHIASRADYIGSAQHQHHGESVALRRDSTRVSHPPR